MARHVAGARARARHGAPVCQQVTPDQSWLARGTEDDWLSGRWRSKAWSIAFHGVCERELGAAWVSCPHNEGRAFSEERTDECPRVTRAQAGRILREVVAIVDEAAAVDPDLLRDVMMSRSLSEAEKMDLLVRRQFAERADELRFTLALTDDGEVVVSSPEPGVVTWAVNGIPLGPDAVIRTRLPERGPVRRFKPHWVIR